MHYYGSDSNYGNLRKRDAQLAAFHKELFMARVSGNKHLIAHIEKKIRRCGQSLYPISEGARSRRKRR